jgi:putative aldouronate transport system permease protein
MKTFFEGLPQSLEEAASIDGMNQFQILLKIVLPLSMPIMATIGLFIAVSHWNDWFGPLIYLNNDGLYPVTLFLRNVVMGSQMASKSGQMMDSSASQVLPQSLQAATVMLVTVPILCIYPFIQKYFVKGVMIGAIKE